MEIIKNILDLNKAIKDFKNFGFVPTMGGIHDGHASLIKNSQKYCKKTIVSLYVNPTQFNSKNDFKNYPRDLNKDIKILNKLKVDYLFIPTSSEIYKNKKKEFKILKKDMILCAKNRKGHFEGVLNIMDRLMTIIKAKRIFMGEKDYQQLFLIKKYLCKKHNVKIISCPTIRDKNKIALSTRNKLLNKKNYNKAISITKHFMKIKKEFNNKKNLPNKIKQNIKIFQNTYNINIEYLEFRNENNLEKSNFKYKYRLFVAYIIGGIRLIDNF